METVTISELVIQAIREIISQYIKPNLVVSILGVCIILLLRYKKDTRIQLLYNGILMFLWCCYSAFLIELTLLTREAGSRQDMNLIFWGTYAEDPLAKSYMIENFLLFIPFGILFALTFRKLKSWKVVGVCLVAGTLISLVIETTQHITARGYFQLDDIWLNAVGGVVGCMVGLIFRFVVCKFVYSYLTTK